MTTIEQLEYRALFAAVDGVPDPTFGDANSGAIRYEAGFSFPRYLPLADGGIIVSTGIAGLEVARLKANGTLDLAYGGGDGKAAGEADEDTSGPIAVQADGKVVVAGSPAVNIVTVARYNPDGTRDVTFDGDGILEAEITDFTSSHIAVRPDGDIFVVGGVTRGFGGDARFVGWSSVQISPEGVIKNILLPGSGFEDYAAQDVAVEPQGSILVAGSLSARFEEAGSSQYDDFYFTRIGLNGEITSTWKGNLTHPTVYRPRGERFRRTSEPSANIVSIAIQPDGKTIAVGEAENGTDRELPSLVIARYDRGRRDDTFGKRGVFTISGKRFDSVTANDVDILADGSIVVAGRMDRDKGTDYNFVLRLNPDGKPDRTFGRRGQSLALGANLGRITEIIPQSDDKYVIFGYTSYDAPRQVIAIRYTISQDKQRR